MAAHKYWRLSNLYHYANDGAAGTAFRGLSLHTVPMPTDMSTAITAGISATVSGGSTADNALGDSVMEHVSTAAKTLTQTGWGAAAITFTLTTPADIKAIGVSWVDVTLDMLYAFELSYSDNGVDWVYAGNPDGFNSRAAPAVGQIVPFQVPRVVSANVTGGTPLGTCYAVLFEQGDQSASIETSLAPVDAGGNALLELRAYGPPGNWTLVAYMLNDTSKNAQAIAWISV